MAVSKFVGLSSNYFSTVYEAVLTSFGDEFDCWFGEPIIHVALMVLAYCGDFRFM